MYDSLERRGLLGVGAATLATLGLSPVVTEGKKKKKGKKKKSQGNGGGCDGCFRSLGIGEETIFAVGNGAEETGTSLCPEGTRAVSGTLFLGNAACDVIEFSATDIDFTGWKLVITCPTGEESAANSVVAICIS